MNVSTPNRLQQLVKGEFETLDADLNAAQQQFEQGQISEQELLEALRVFPFPDPTLIDQFGEWIQAFPDSYAAHTVLAQWLLDRAWEARGGRTANLISDQGLRGLAYYLERAEAVARHATNLSANPLAAWLLVGYCYNTQGCNLSLNEVQQEQYPDWFTRPLQENPHSLILRRLMLGYLRSEWGGSEEHMLTFVRQQQESGLLSAGDMQKLWAEFHSNVSHYEMHFTGNPQKAVERAELAANMRESQAAQLLVALTEAKAPQPQRKAALERYLKAVEQDKDLKPSTNFYWALYSNTAWIQPFMPQIYAFLERTAQKGDQDAAIALGRLSLVSPEWNAPSPLPLLRSAVAQGNREAAETVVQVQEKSSTSRLGAAEQANVRQDILSAADLGSEDMSWRVYREFGLFKEQFELDDRAKYRYLLRAADAGHNDARFELAQQLRAGRVEVGEDGVLRPVDTHPLQESLDYAKHLLERAAAEKHRGAYKILQVTSDTDWDSKTAKRISDTAAPQTRTNDFQKFNGQQSKPQPKQPNKSPTTPKDSGSSGRSIRPWLWIVALLLGLVRACHHDATQQNHSQGLSPQHSSQVHSQIALQIHPHDQTIHIDPTWNI